MTRLILVRHGQTSCNVADIWHGWDDCELTEEGQAQARAVAERLRHEPVAAIYSSDSPRARQTAEAIGRMHRLQPITSQAFRERYAGEYEGRTTAEIVQANPGLWEQRSADYWGWTPPGGETFREVLERCRPGIEDIRTRHPNETVVLVSHMSALRVLICHLTGTPIEQTYLTEFPSTAVSIIDLGEDGVRVEVVNDAAHYPSR